MLDRRAHDEAAQHVRGEPLLAASMPDLPQGELVAALGTRHAKEQVIAPALAQAGVRVVLADIDTDQFGTFSGTIPRAGTQLQAACAKAQAAAHVTHLSSVPTRPTASAATPNATRAHQSAPPDTSLRQSLASALRSPRQGSLDFA